MTGDRPLLGIMLMIGFCVLAPIGDTIAKLLGGIIPLWQLLMVRFGAQAILLTPLVKRAALPPMTGRLVWLMTIRTVLHIIGIGAMFTALRFLPLADCIAIAFVMPFIMLLLGKVVLGEEVGTRRLAACTVGFIGTLLVIQPSFAEVGPPALLPLVVAVAFAFFMLTTRQIAKDIDPIALQAISGAIACIILGVLFAVFPGDAQGAIAIVMPEAGEAVLMLAIGIIGTVAHLLMVWSLRFAPSATVAPMQYLEIPFATVVGWIVFRDLPNGLAALGIVITMAAGLYVIYRERAVSMQGAQV
jgi:drug/metabolite transporter (DMT)-like permease